MALKASLTRTKVDCVQRAMMEARLEAAKQRAMLSEQEQRPAERFPNPSGLGGEAPSAWGGASWNGWWGPADVWRRGQSG